MKSILRFLFGETGGLCGALKLGFAALSAMIGSALGGFDGALIFLIYLTIADFVSGTLAAVYQRRISSSIGYRGIIRKIGIYFIVALAYRLDLFLQSTPTLRAAIVGFYIAVEGISLIENWAGMGLPLPKIILDVLNKIKSGTKEP